MNVSGNTQTIIIPRNEVTRYPTTSMDTSKFTFNMIASESMEGVQTGVTAISPSDWAFADCRTVPFPGTPDTTRVCLRNGFDNTKLYELFYEVYDPIVAGIGLAATRDINSFLRYAAQDDFGTKNPVAGHMKWGIIEGSSQSGTFVKLLIMLGFNQDEQDRIVWDGANPQHRGARYRPQSSLCAAGRARGLPRARARRRRLVPAVARRPARTSRNGA